MGRSLLWILLSILSFAIPVTYAQTGKYLDLDLVMGASPTLKNKFSIDINERKVISGDIYIYPLQKPVLQNGLLSPLSVEGYNVLTTGVSMCSLVSRLTLERLTGKTSDSLRDGDIPKGDAVSLISLGKKNGALRTIGLLSGQESVYSLERSLTYSTKKSKNSVWDIYLYHPNSYGYNKGHRFVYFKGSDNQNYIVDPILGDPTVKAKRWSDYFESILSIKSGSVLYIGRGYKPMNPKS